MDTKVTPAAAPTSAYQQMLDEARARRASALAMHKQGKTDAEIGDALGVSRQRARQLVVKALSDKAGR